MTYRYTVRYWRDEREYTEILWDGIRALELARHHADQMRPVAIAVELV